MNPIRIGVIGLGKIARDQHLPAIEGNPRFTLAATVDRSAPPSSTNFVNHEEMIRSGLPLDAVAITTPPEPRYAIARDCIAAGLHVLLEKPPTATLGEIEDLRRKAQAGGVTLFTAWHAQHNLAVAASANILRGQKIHNLTITWHEDVEKWHPDQDWIWQAGGFGVFDPGINAFSIATAISPDPLFVRHADLYFRDGAETPIAADVQLASPCASGKLRCSLDWRRTAGEEWTIEVTTEDRRHICLRDGGALLSIDGVEQSLPVEGEYKAIYRRFAELIDSGTSDVDIEPLRLVADCFLNASRHTLPLV